MSGIKQPDKFHGSKAKLETGETPAARADLFKIIGETLRNS
jgi:hypothetical protein